MKMQLATFFMAALAVVAATCSSASADTPLSGKFDFAVVSTATAPIDPETNLPRNPFLDVIVTIKGEANQIGNFSGWVSYRVNMETGAFSGKAVKVAANGDLLFEDVTGQFTDAAGVNSVGTITITDGTGRFKGASGAGTFAGNFTTPTAGVIKFNGSCNVDAANRAKSPPANSPAYNATGQVIFANIVDGLTKGELVPYTGVSASTLTGLGVQTGTIQATSTLRQIELGKLQFDGVVGPHPVLGTNVHVISTAKGDIHCTWTALFTLQFDAQGTVTFSGDGNFTVVGGTGIYSNATGNFQTLFYTQPVAPDTDTASASVIQTGTIVR